jgi:hypothetical protein
VLHIHGIELSLRDEFGQVMKYLEKKSIVWTEEESNPGTILIPINQKQDQQD